MVVIVGIIGVIILLVGGYFVYQQLNDNKKPKEREIVQEIKEYNYYLEDNSSKIYKNLFSDLVNILDKEEINYEDYAKTIAQMLVIDFYNLDNKISKK